MADIRERGNPPGIVYDFRRMTITFPDYLADEEYEMVTGDDGVEYEAEVEHTCTVAAKNEVCDVCDGRGTHVNPAIDSHGIGAEEWGEQDEDEREGYCNGRYDVTCSGCGGRRVRLVPRDPSPSWDELWRGHSEDMAECAAERRGGC